MTIWEWQMRELREKYSGWRLREVPGQVIAEREGQRIAVSTPLVLEAQLEAARWRELTRRQ